MSKPVSYEEVTREFFIHPRESLPKDCSNGCRDNQPPAGHPDVFLGKANSWLSNGHVVYTANCGWCGQWEGYFSYSIDVKEPLQVFQGVLVNGGTV